MQYLLPAQFLFPPEHICELLHPVCAALPELGPGPVPHGQHPGIAFIGLLLLSFYRAIAPPSPMNAFRL